MTEDQVGTTRCAVPARQRSEDGTNVVIARLISTREPSLDAALGGGDSVASL